MPLTPLIQPVSAIEASASEHPDDVSTINIRINLDNETSAPVQPPDHINIVVRSPSPAFSTATPADQTSTKRGLLTLVPKSITPVSGQSGWALKFLTERPVAGDSFSVESIFRATKSGAVTNNGNIAANAGLEFTLRDVQVVDAEGDTFLRVEQFDAPESTPVVGPIILPANVTVAPGGLAAFQVRLATPAVGDVTIALTSSDITKVTVPSSVSFAAGTTTPVTQPQVTGVGIGSATITAAASGLATASVQVIVPTTFTLTKVFPSLGIERFVADSVVINSGQSITLSWVTKGATEIHLEGLAPADQTNFNNQFPDARDAKLHAASFPAPNAPPPAFPHPLLQPQTTSTYTLRARNGTAEVTQQVTVVVKDVVVAPAMQVGVTSPPGAGNLLVQGNVTAGTVTSTGVVNAGSFTTAGSISAQSLTISNNIAGSTVNLLSVSNVLNNVHVDGTLFVDNSRDRTQSLFLHGTSLKGGRDAAQLSEVSADTDHLLTLNGEMQIRWTTDENQPTGPNPVQEQMDGSIIRVENPKVLTLSPTQKGSITNSVHLGFTANPTGAGIANAGGGGVQFKVFDQFFIRWADKDVGVILDRNHIWRSPSDVSLKQDIASLDNVLSRVRSLRPVEFAWRDQGSKDIGFVAQEVESVFPSLVGAVSTENGGTAKTLPYSSFSVLAIAAIRELASGYEKTMSELCEQIAGLTARLEKLEGTRKKRRNRSRRQSKKGR